MIVKLQANDEIDPAILINNSCKANDGAMSLYVKGEKRWSDVSPWSEERRSDGFHQENLCHTTPAVISTTHRYGGM
jgi:hypothetical protein